MRLDSQRLIASQTIKFGLVPTSVDEEDEGSRRCAWNGGSVLQERRRYEWALEGETIRKELMELLSSRHEKLSVPITLWPGVHVEGEVFQLPSPSDLHSAAHEYTNQMFFSSTTPQFIEENLILQIEAGEQGQVPILIIKRNYAVREEKQDQHWHDPAIVILHSSYKSKECLRALLKNYATRGYVAIGVDSRHHGQRAASKTAYSDALVSAWKNSKEMPFIFDTAWDLVKLMDYLTSRDDIDSKRIGILGISLGGMHTWFAATLDPRYAVVVPIIGVQNFGWAIKNDKWHARVASIPHAFEIAAKDFGKKSIDSKVVSTVLDKIAPGLIDQFDSQHTIPAIAPRPLLILNGKEDPRCPIDGLEFTIDKTKKIYADYGFPHNFKFIAEPNMGHYPSSSMLHEASCWFDKFLEPQVSH
ncbi:hypothetical protein O6H91_19G030200 [Diphasiastrum complanatum]|nr:hypothetical protein O6H91_19G030200 [Diphasiastrum complanatum]